MQKQVKTLEEKLEFLVQEESEASEELRVYEGKLKSQKDSTASKQKFINEKLLELARYETIIETALKDALEKYNLTQLNNNISVCVEVDKLQMPKILSLYLMTNHSTI